MGQLYTIGHSTYPVELFIELAKTYELDYILDVRSTPFSRFASQYNSNVIKGILAENDIKYFGARQPDSQYYPKGYLDFSLFRQSELFKTDLENVKKGLENNNIALMCTEKIPATVTGQ